MTQEAIRNYLKHQAYLRRKVGTHQYKAKQAANRRIRNKIKLYGHA